MTEDYYNSAEIISAIVFMKIQVSELIVRYLEKLGIEYIFGMPGAHILPAYDCMTRSSR